MLRFVLRLLLVVCAAMPAMAEGPLPERRLVVTRDVDFYGSDLQPLFDTTLGACQTLCLNEPSCAAFTFNTRSNACFPKTAITERQPYSGAVSAEVFGVNPAVMDTAQARMGELAFLRQADLSAARDEAAALGMRHSGGQWGVETLLQAAREQEAAGNLGNALGWTGAALAQTDAADLWADYARLALAAGDALRSGGDQRTLRSRALSATVNAYLRSDAAPLRTRALMLMAQALEVNGRGRDMIPALRLAHSLSARQDVADRLDGAIAKYGFRIVEHVVNSDLADPQICAQFSEDLARAGVDYTPYVRLPSQTMAVEATDRRLCISGLTHGERYTVTFRSGLPSQSGEALAKDVTLTLYVPDRSPSVVFAGRSYVLPKTADAGIPVETVNLDRIDLALRRVSDRNLLRAIQDQYFGRPLSHWEKERFRTDIAEDIWSGTGEVGNRLNQSMTTRLPMGGVIADLPVGVYALTASIKGADPYDDPGATQWFVLSDIGLTTLSGTDGLHVFARRLTDAGAFEGLTVTLLSRANRVLGTATTNAEGYAVFAAGLMRGTGGAAPALVMAEQGDADFAFLSLRDPAFDLSDRGVEGRAPSGPTDVFLTTERGAYRAGETVYSTALMRAADVSAVDGVPLTAVLTRPDGVEYSRHFSAQALAGGHVFDMPLAPTVPRGTWDLAVFADTDAPALASRRFLVEDFVPERIDFDLSLPDGPIAPSGVARLDVAVRYLFGADGANLPVEGDLRLKPLRRIEGLTGFLFGRYDEVPNTQTSGFGGIDTDAKGQATVMVPLPEAGATDRPYEAELIVRVAEGSGRPVERRITRAVAPAGPVIGIRPMADGVVAQGGTAAFDLMGFDTGLNPTPMQVTWSLNRVETRYQWYQEYGRWNWEPVTTRTPVATGRAALGADPVQVSAPVDWGRYELVVEREDGGYTATSVDFYAGWYAPADASATPDTLDVSLDKPSYRSGDTATLRIVPRYAGKALVTVMSDRVIAMKAVDVSEGETLVALPVTDEWGGGAYVTATVLRPMDVAAGQAPARALGLAHAAVDPEDRRLAVTIETPDQSAPRGPMSATVVVAGVPEGEQAYVTLAAVDVGILNLTGFQSPDPSGHYFGQRRLGIEIRDVYGRLINGMDGAMGRLRSGGDAASAGRMQSPPPTGDLVAFFSGPVAVGPDGRADIRFEMPEFNGTVRLMAVAWSAQAVGEAEADVLVRDPVVLSASLPRFLAPNDRSRLLLELTHASGPAGEVALEVRSDGLLIDTGGLPETVMLGEAGTARLTVPIAAAETGDHRLMIALTTPAGERLEKELVLGVRSNGPAVSQTRRFTLQAGAEFVLDDNVFGGLKAGTAEALVSAGPLARFDAAGLLASLGRYPYGCTEQVTSQTMPLLYLSSLAGALGLGDEAAIDAQIGAAVTKILTRQGSNGAFGLWSAGSGDAWLDAYVTDFLSRARAKGHSVPDLAFSRAIDNLRNRIAYVPDFDSGGEDIAYALMVLAREGQAAMGELRYYADVKAEAMATPLALAQLGHALALYGDPTRADRLFALAARRLSALPDGLETAYRTDYGSAMRDAAGLLSLAVEAGSTALDMAPIRARLSPARALSTQEQSWALLAAHALVADGGVSGLSVDGTPVAGPFVRRFGASLGGATVIQNTASGPTDLTLTTVGVPEVPEPAGGYGYAIERQYFTMEGAPLTGEVTTGDRFVTVLTVRPAEETGARLMINDPLPAGYEIDNPSLLRSGDIRALDWLETANAEHSEFRSDRFLAAVDWRGTAPLRLAYIVRAVSAGTFHHPAATVEDMYRPQYRARTGIGRLVVAE